MYDIHDDDMRFCRFVVVCALVRDLMYLMGGLKNVCWEKRQGTTTHFLRAAPGGCRKTREENHRTDVRVCFYMELCTKAEREIHRRNYFFTCGRFPIRANLWSMCGKLSTTKTVHTVVLYNNIVYNTRHATTYTSAGFIRFRRINRPSRFVRVPHAVYVHYIIITDFAKSDVILLFATAAQRVPFI